jgi:glycosyltransferase involved in cell wall biosynthesis
VAIESMAAGTVVVAADIGGLKEIIADGRTGLLVPTNNSQAIKNAVCRLYANPALKEALIRNGKERVAQCYTVEKYMKSLEELYADI